MNTFGVLLDISQNLYAVNFIEARVVFCRTTAETRDRGLGFLKAVYVFQYIESDLFYSEIIIKNKRKQFDAAVAIKSACMFPVLYANLQVYHALCSYGCQCCEVLNLCLCRVLCFIIAPINKHSTKQLKHCSKWSFN